MWKVTAATSDQTAKVTKLLNEDWEPYAVVGGLKKKGRAIFKMYFRKWEGETLEATVESTPPLDVEDLVERIGEKFLSAFKEALNDTPELYLNVDEELTREIKREDLNDGGETEVIQRREVLGNTKVDVDEEAEPVAEREGPEGDGFRVVDEVPAEFLNDDGRTDAQKEAINKIRDSHKTNITTHRPTPDGFIKVLVENLEYQIAPDGKWSKKDTGANTSSLVV